MSDNPLCNNFAGQCPAWPTNDRLTDIDGKAFLHYYVKFRKDVLQHLGIRPGDKIELDLLPDGRGVLKAARPAGTIASFVGLLAGKTQKVATIEEINEAAAQGWAGKQ